MWEKKTLHHTHPPLLLRGVEGWGWRPQPRPAASINHWSCTVNNTTHWPTFNLLEEWDTHHRWYEADDRGFQEEGQKGIDVSVPSTFIYFITTGNLVIWLFSRTCINAPVVFFFTWSHSCFLSYFSHTCQHSNDHIPNPFHNHVQAVGPEVHEGSLQTLSQAFAIWFSAPGRSCGLSTLTFALAVSMETLLSISTTKFGPLLLCRSVLNPGKCESPSSQQWTVSWLAYLHEPK